MHKSGGFNDLTRFLKDFDQRRVVEAVYYVVEEVSGRYGLKKFRLRLGAERALGGWACYITPLLKTKVAAQSIKSQPHLIP